MNYLELANKKITVDEFDDFNYKKHIVDANSINKTVKDYYTGKIPQGYKIGIKEFDDHFVFKEKSLYAFTGRKGKGKTSVMKIFQIMQSIVNDLVWVVAFQENSDWGSKVSYLNYLFGTYARDVEKENPILYKLASDWFDKHFIFLDVETIEDAIKTTDYLIKKDNIPVHAIFLDPANSFEFGYKDTGNTYQDGVYSSKKVLRWCKKNVSVHVSQHPNVTAARNKEKEITPIDAEHGFWNNKAHFTWCLNREDDSDENRISIWNVREKLTGGNSTPSDDPIVLEWSPTKINIKKGGNKYKNVVQYLVRKHNPFNYDFKDDIPDIKEIKPIPNMNPNEVFGDTNDDLPF